MVESTLWNRTALFTRKSGSAGQIGRETVRNCLSSSHKRCLLCAHYTVFYAPVCDRPRHTRTRSIWVLAAVLAVCKMVLLWCFKNIFKTLSKHAPFRELPNGGIEGLDQLEEFRLWCLIRIWLPGPSWCLDGDRDLDGWRPEEGDRASCVRCSWHTFSFSASGARNAWVVKIEIWDFWRWVGGWKVLVTKTDWSIAPTPAAN